MLVTLVVVVVIGFWLLHQSRQSDPVKIKVGVPKIRGTFLGGPIIRNRIFWGSLLEVLYLGKLPGKYITKHLGRDCGDYCFFTRLF